MYEYIGKVTVCLTVILTPMVLLGAICEVLL